jgi:DNA-binding transcriptional LysR family regulator
MPGMDTTDLRVFEAVARLGGMSRAAAELHTVQSNVTARIRALEQELGLVLFDRHSRGVTLTAAGRRLLPYAARAQRLVAEAAAAARDDGAPRGPLALGSLETTAAMHLAPMLAAYARAHPAVDLVLRTGTTLEMVEEVLAERLDGAFVSGPVAHPDLVAEATFREELALMSAPGIADAWTALAAPGLRIIVLRAGCSYRQRLEDLLARRGVIGPRLLEFGTMEAIFGAVEAGLGVTLLPTRLMRGVLAPGRLALHRLPPADAMVDTVFVRRREGRASSALAAFLDVVRDVPAVAA